MKYFGQLGLILVILAALTSGSCKKTDKVLTQADSVWINFKTQLGTGNIEYLIKNSLDSIQCVDCDIETERPTEFYDTDFILRNHLDKFKLESIRDKEFDTYVIDDLIRVNYSFPATFFHDHGYNLIFTFQKVDNIYLFTGVIVT
jgi:hypothetical protein